MPSSGGRGPPVHFLHVQERVFGRAALPEGVEVGEDHVAGCSDPRVYLELEVGVDVANRDTAGDARAGPLDVVDQFIFVSIPVYPGLRSSCHRCVTFVLLIFYCGLDSFLCSC